MEPRIARFDWDRGNREKCRKHGLSLDEIEAAFARPLAILPDPAHSRGEERFKAIGVTAQGRHIFVVFTLRGRDGLVFVRPISARPMHRKEVDYYEKAAASFPNR